MSSSRADRADRPPRWATAYLVHDLTIDEARERVSEAVGLQLDERLSSYVGRYFVYDDGEIEFQLKLNWVDDGELVHPDVPEGIFVHYSSLHEDLYRDVLDGLPFLEFVRSYQFGARAG